MTFDEFKAKVNAELIKLCDMTSDDLPDYDYAIAWETRRNPKAVAKAALRAAKGG
jgi:hypothetical protein